MPPPTRPRPWLELIIYLLVFVVVGAGLYALKRQLKGPARPKYVPMHAPEDAAPLQSR